MILFFWRLRILSFYCIIVIILLLMLVVSLIVNIFSMSYFIRYKLAELFSIFFVFFLKIILNINYKVSGLDKLPKDKDPYLVLANHQSFWENFFMQIIIPIHSWVIKKELYYIPVFGFLLKMLNPIAINRKNSMSVTEILNEGVKKIESGLSLVIFPESTRVPVDRSVKFKPSAAKLALTTGVPIVMIVHNAGLFWPKGFWFLKSGTITVKVIEVISKAELFKYDTRSLTNYIESRINREKGLLIE